VFRYSVGGCCGRCGSLVRHDYRFLPVIPGQRRVLLRP
jgi:hypothetical protein